MDLVASDARYLKAIRDMYPNELEVVAFNDIGDMKTMAHLLKYDSTYGRFNGTVEVADDGLMIDGKKVKVFKETDPAAIKWGDLGIDIVIESTGLFTIKEDGVNKKGKTVKGAVNHITSGGAKKVIISAPAEGEDLTVVLGVNEDQYDPKVHHVVSNASCTTNCLAPAAKVVHDLFTIKRGFHDHHPLVHQRPEGVGYAALGPAPRSRLWVEYHPDHHWRCQSHFPGHP
jgi:glyceraldehyde 3-phosphate dehydrogenase